MHKENLEKLLKEVINEDNKITIRQNYERELVGFITEIGMTDEVINIVLEGFNIDFGKTFIQYILTCDSGKDRNKIYAMLEKNKYFNRNIESISFKLLCTLMHASLEMKNADDKLWQIIVRKLPHMAKQEDNAIGCENVFCDLFVDKLNENVNLPDIFKLKCTEGDIERFTICINSFCEKLSSKLELKDIIARLKDWVNYSTNNINEDIENSPNKKANTNTKKQQDSVSINYCNKSKNTHENIEEKKNQNKKAKIDQFKDLVKYYEKVENDYTSSLLKIQELYSKIDILNGDIEKMSNIISCQTDRIFHLETSLSLAQKTIDKKDSEISNRDSVISIFDKDKNNSLSELLNSIATSLKYEYLDFQESINCEINDTLGEVYREKIIEIFKILEKNGIKMEV